MKNNSFVRNSLYATFANAISLLASIFLSLVLPKFVSIEDYGYWQLFVLYSSYVGFLHFGFCDGIYLKYGGNKLRNIDYDKISPLIFFYELAQLFFGLILLLYGIISSGLFMYKLVWFCLAIYVVVANSNTIISFILLATGEIVSYSRIIAICRTFLFLSGIIILCLPLCNKIIYIFGVYLLTYLAELLLFHSCFVKNGIHLRDYIHGKIDFNLFKSLIISGFILMFANIASNFMMGSGRMIVESFWDISVFAKLSFAVSISMFFLAFVSQLGYVVFPIFRNMEYNQMAKSVLTADFLIGYIMMCLFLLITPLSLFINTIMPNYKESIEFIAYLLPTSLYLTKTQVLYTPLYKSLNKQKLLLFINLACLIFAIAGYFTACYFRTITLIVVVMFISAFLRYVLLVKYSNQKFNFKVHANMLLEFISLVTLIVLFQYLDSSCFLMVSVLIILAYSFLNRKMLSGMRYLAKRKFS